MRSDSPLPIDPTREIRRNGIRQTLQRVRSLLTISGEAEFRAYNLEEEARKRIERLRDLSSKESLSEN